MKSFRAVKRSQKSLSLLGGVADAAISKRQIATPSQKSRGLAITKLFWCLFFCCMASGCVNLQKKFPDIKTYTLDLTQQGHLTAQAAPVSIHLAAFSAVPQFADRYLTYRTGETVYEQDFYNQFLASPAKIIEDQFSAWIKGSPLVSFVLPANSLAVADYDIEGSVVDLSGDYRHESEPKAVLKLQMTVSRRESGDLKVLFQKLYSAEILINSPSPKMLTQGWNIALGQVAAMFENDFKDFILDQNKI